MSRLARLAGRLHEPLLVTSEVNVRYLTGFRSSNAALLVQPGGETHLYTDFRYAEAARDVSEVTFVETKRDVVADLAERLSGSTVGFEAARLGYAAWETLRAGGVGLVVTSNVVEELRAIKDAHELELVSRAASISDRVYEDLAEEQLSGRSERDLAWWVERRFRELGADATAFEPIVAAGPNGARPHHHPGDDLIPAGTLVVIDIGCTIDGYCSDCTRTFATGPLSPELERAYALVADAQAAGLAAVRAGVRGVEADAASRTGIEAAGLGGAYAHGLGHGIGLDVHEAPTLRPESTDTLQAGNLVTVEPGLYLPGAGGCRIEDLVAVTDTGCERLTRFTRELVTVC